MAKLKLHIHEFFEISLVLVWSTTASKRKEMKKAVSRLPIRKSGRTKPTSSSSSKASSGSLKRTGLRVPGIFARCRKTGD